MNAIRNATWTAALLFSLALPCAAQKIDRPKMDEEINLIKEKQPQIKSDALVSSSLKLAAEVEKLGESLMKRYENAETQCETLTQGNKGNIKALFTRAKERAKICMETAAKIKDDRELQKYSNNNNVRMADVSPNGDVSVTGIAIACRDLYEAHSKINPEINQARSALFEAERAGYQAYERAYEETLTKPEELEKDLDAKIKELQAAVDDARRETVEIGREYERAANETLTAERAKRDHDKRYKNTFTGRELSDWSREKERLKNEFNAANRRERDLVKKLEESRKKVQERERPLDEATKRRSEIMDSQERQDNLNRADESWGKANLDAAMFIDLFGDR